MSRRLRLSGDFDFHAIAKLTPGFVGADLAALTKEAAAIAVTRIFQQLDGSASAPEEAQPAAAPLAPAPGYASALVRPYYPPHLSAAK